MAKSADAFRTISEVSAELDVPKHVLRFWEQRFKQLKPLKRGGGRRYYRPEDVELIKGIKALLNRDAYTIRGVQRILKEQGVELVKRVAKGDATALITAVPQSSAEAPGASTATRSAASGARTPAKPKPQSGASAGVSVSREVLAAAIAELASCRALLAEEPARNTSSKPAALAAGSRR
jgi:DNA-binding transcriptional MerR regulator